MQTPRSYDEEMHQVARQMQHGSEAATRAFQVPRGKCSRDLPGHLAQGARSPSPEGKTVVVFKPRQGLHVHAVINALPDLVFVVRDGQIELMNRPALKLMGTRTEAAISRLFHPDDRDAAMAQLAMAAASGKGQTIGRLLRPDGTHLDVELSVQPMEGDDQGLFIVVARDLNARKEGRQQVLVAERMAAVSSLAAGVAHEINNPLASVIANLDYAIDELRIGLETSAAVAEVRQALNEARESALRVKEVVVDLQFLSWGESSALQGTIDVHRVLESALRLASTEIHARARLVKDFGAVPAVSGNTAILGQVCLTVISHALLAMQSGRADSNELRIATRVVDSRVAIEVRDTGSGLSAAELDKLLLPFFNLRHFSVGTRMGLSICSRMVEALGGELNIESQLGQGTTYRMLLPAAAQA